MQQAYVYTDGSCDNRTGVDGGYGVVIVYGDKVFKISGGKYCNTTSQRMELMAVIAALKKLKELECMATIFIDTRYIVDSVNQKWLFRWEKDNFKDRKNSGMWKVFLELYRHFDDGDIILKWVKGHDGNEYNEMADRLAWRGAKKEGEFIVDEIG